MWLLNVTISVKHINDLKKSNIEINVREMNDLKNSQNVFTYFHVVSQIVTYRQHITSRGTDDTIIVYLKNVLLKNIGTHLFTRVA